MDFATITEALKWALILFLVGTGVLMIILRVLTAEGKAAKITRWTVGLGLVVFFIFYAGFGPFQIFSIVAFSVLMAKA